MVDQQTHRLAEIGYQRIRPSSILQPFIQWFWAIQSNGPILQQRNEFMHSHASLSLVFNWGDELELSSGRYPRSVILEKVSSQSRQMILSGNVQAFGILFRAGGAFPFFGIPMQQLKTINCLDSFKQMYLHEQLADIHHFRDRTERVESWLTNLLSNDQTASPIIPASLKLIADSYGKQSIPRIADDINLSERHLERLFKKEVGLTPKAYARLTRLHQARMILKQTSTETLTEVAHRTGFYDQAHFNHEFKNTVGMTPGAYLSRRQKR
jgi:AraC-like DNA-binding protein